MKMIQEERESSWPKQQQTICTWKKVKNTAISGGGGCYKTVQNEFETGLNYRIYGLPEWRNPKKKTHPLTSRSCL
jgi:hypothetical protein